ncbi:16245_t:CDS:2, partial [Dentiscutata erythropus]
ITVSSSCAMTAIPVEQEILNNALAQKRAACSIEAAKTKLKELEQNFDNEKEQDFNKSTNTSVPWFWIEKHCSLCQYSIDIKYCTNLSCYGSTRAQEAMDFLQPFDGFLSPVTKARDGHYINPVHLLQYSERFKVPDYDEHCPSINQTIKTRKEPEISESVAEFVIISNSATMEDLDLLLLQQNENYLDECRECW